MLTTRYRHDFNKESIFSIAFQGIVHSDLKPANFLLVGGNLKLIDFGIASSIPSNRTSIVKESQMGTLSYMPPEAIVSTSSPTHNGKELYKVSYFCALVHIVCFALFIKEN